MSQDPDGPSVTTRAPAAGEVREVLVLADARKPAVQEFSATLVDWFRERVERVELECDVRSFCESLATRPLNERAWNPALLCVLGGDGAILTTVRAYGHAPVPTIGINFGRVGFLASTLASRWEEVLSGVLAGQGVLERRMRIAARLERAGVPEVGAIALNEVTVQRGSHQGMLTVGLKVGDDWVTDYRADGLIVATPTGSTAHSLSAGGPILAPEMDALVATPICPQGLASRPIVLRPDHEIVLEVLEATDATTLVVDGHGLFELTTGDRVHIARHPVPYPLLAWEELDPYRRLRERLGWSGAVGPGRAPE